MLSNGINYVLTCSYTFYHSCIRKFARQYHRTGSMKKTILSILKPTVILFGLILLVYMLINLRDILTPICFALLLAVLLNRLVVKLERIHIPKFWAISIAILLAFTVIASAAYFISTQIMSFGNDLPLLQKRFLVLFSEFQTFVRDGLGVNIKQQNLWIAEAEASMKPMIGQTIGTVAGTLGVMMILPVYTFVLLFYKNHFLTFLYEVFGDSDSERVAEVLQETKGAIQRYMIGLLLEGIVVAILNTTALFIFDIKMLYY